MQRIADASQDAIRNVLAEIEPLVVTCLSLFLFRYQLSCPCIYISPLGELLFEILDVNFMRITLCIDGYCCS